MIRERAGLRQNGRDENQMRATARCRIGEVGRRLTIDAVIQGLGGGRVCIPARWTTASHRVSRGCQSNGVDSSGSAVVTTFGSLELDAARDTAITL
jgi:hypothetical protein